jgi:aspartate kinase
MEQAIVSGIAHDRSEAKLTVNRVPDRPGVAAALFGALAHAGVNVDMIVQNVSHDGTTDISFTVPRVHVVEGERISKQVAIEIGAESVDVDADIAKVSLVGAGMKTHPGVAAKVFEAMSGAGINIEMISTSTIRISCVIRADQVETAVKALHSAFNPPTISEEVGA